MVFVASRAAFYWTKVYDAKHYGSVTAAGAAATIRQIANFNRSG
jgi:hypothetical protein